VSVPDHPPTDSPPIVLTVEYGTGDGPLLVRASAADTPTGVPASDRTFRDVLVDARLTLQAGGDDTVYGLYVRQTAGASYAAWGMSPTGRIVAGVVANNAWHPMADADLAPDLPFARGLGQPNRFQVLALGPSLVFVLNGAIVTGINVDARFKEGFLGYWLLRGQQAEEAVMAVGWLQLRAVLPNQ
jgi:hypothetical protein